LSLLLLLRARQQYQITAARMARNATPPTALPAMAPMFEGDSDGLCAVDGVAAEVGEVVAEDVLVA